MPMIMRSPTLAANAPYTNILAGSQFEFARQRGVVSFGVCEAATGLFCTINSGADVIAEEFEPPILTRYPIIPDEMYFTDVVDAGDRLNVGLRNSTGAGVICRAVVQLS